MQTLADRQRLRIWANAALWTAGHSLTSVAFLSYFAVDLGASAFALALLAALPAEPGDSTHELALFRQVAGTIAGLSGLLGGWALDRLIEHFRGSDAKVLPVTAFLVLFAISGVGRLTAALLVLRVPVDDVLKGPGRVAPVLIHVDDKIGATRPGS